VWLEELNLLQCVWQRYESIGYVIRLTRIKITQIAIIKPTLKTIKKDSILSQLLELQQYLYLANTYIDKLAHKILHTFEKMDAINPTLEPRDQDIYI